MTILEGEPITSDDIVERFPLLAVHQVYEPGSTKARLVLALNTCLRRNRTPRSKDRKHISRVHFAKQIGVTGSRISQFKDILTDYEAVLEIVEPLDTLPQKQKFRANIDLDKPLDDAARFVVALYSSVLKHQHYPPDSTAKKVVQFLNAKIMRGGLERSARGKISRKAMAVHVGTSRFALSRYIPILEDYEKALGKASATKAKIFAMRELLEMQMREGLLQIRDGKVSRVQLCRNFDTPHIRSLIIENRNVAELVAEFDDKVKNTGYQPRDVLEKIKQLEAMLYVDPPVCINRVTINRREISRRIGISITVLRRSPYREVFDAAQQDFHKSQRGDRLNAFAGGRTFKFRCLVEQGWPREFAVRARDCFERVYRNQAKERASSHFRGLVRLLSFIARQDTQSCHSLRKGLAQGINVRSLEADFTIATQEYRNNLLVSYDNSRTRNGIITITNVVIRHLSSDSVLPPAQLLLIKFPCNNKTHLRSVAEALESTVQKRTRPHIDDYLEFATSMLKQAGAVRQIETSAKDQGDFTRVLRKELEVVQIAASDSPASLILRVLERRLSLIKRAALSIVQKAQEKWEYGNSLLKRGHVPSDVLNDLFKNGPLNWFQRAQLLRQYYPTGENAEQGIANLLKVVAERYDYLYPAAKISGRPEGQFFAKRAEEYGGAKKIQEYLLPSPEVICAIITIYLLESGSNVSVGRTLYFDCIEKAEEPHHCKITGYKARAGGKPIFVVLETRSDVIGAMKWLQEALDRIPNIESETKKQLFIIQGRTEKLKLIEEFTYRSWFKRLIASISELATLRLTPNMLRPSVLLRAALESDGRTQLSMAIGQHGRDVHGGYVDKYPMRFLRDSEIRHFQHAMETVVISGLEDIHVVLGVDADNMGRRVEAVMKTGLGTLCRNRKGRPGNDGSACQSIDCWNDCPQLILIAKKEEIAILQIWQHSLRLVEGEWIRDQPERWEMVWLPWLCFVDAVEVKMRQSFASVWREATTISQTIMSAPNFQPMRLF